MLDLIVCCAGGQSTHYDAQNSAAQKQKKVSCSRGHCVALSPESQL